MDGRTIWVREDDVEGRIVEGAMVTAARDLSEWCLRGDDGSEPVAAGTVLGDRRDAALRGCDGDGDGLPR